MGIRGLPFDPEAGLDRLLLFPPETTELYCEPLFLVTLPELLLRANFLPDPLFFLVLLNPFPKYFAPSPFDLLKK